MGRKSPDMFQDSQVETNKKGEGHQEPPDPYGLTTQGLPYIPVFFPCGRSLEDEQ